MSPSLKQRLLFLCTFLCLWTVLAAGTSTAGKPGAEPFDPVIVYHRYYDGLFLMSSDGVTQRLTRAKRNSIDRCPAWSPDGNWICFYRDYYPSQGGGDLYIIRPDGSDATLIRSLFPDDPQPGNNGDDVVWSPNGRRLVFASDTIPRGICVVEVFDEDYSLVPDHPMQLLVSTKSEGQVASPSFSPDWDMDLSNGYQGELTWSTTVDGPGYWDFYTLALPLPVDEESGNPVVIPISIPKDPDVATAHYEHPTWSPDGTRLAFAMDMTGADGGSGIAVADVVFDMDGIPALTNVRPVTPTATPYSRISWSGDNSIVFDDLSGSNGTWDIFGINLNDLDRVPLTDTDDALERSPAWNPAWDPSNP